MIRQQCGPSCRISTVGTLGRRGTLTAFRTASRGILVTVMTIYRCFRESAHTRQAEQTFRKIKRRRSDARPFHCCIIRLTKLTFVQAVSNRRGTWIVNSRMIVQIYGVFESGHRRLRGAGGAGHGGEGFPSWCIWGEQEVLFKVEFLTRRPR